MVVYLEQTPECVPQDSNGQRYAGLLRPYDVVLVLLEFLEMRTDNLCLIFVAQLQNALVTVMVEKQLTKNAIIISRKLCTTSMCNIFCYLEIIELVILILM